MFSRIESTRHSNHCIFLPQNYGSPFNDTAEHISGLGLARIDFERCAVAGEVIYSVEGDSTPTSQQDEEARIATLAHALKKLGNPEDAAEFMRCLNDICKEGDVRYRQVVASYYYGEIAERGLGVVLKEMAIIAMHLASLNPVPEEEENLMIKVFIGGSRSITKLPATVAARIDNIVEGDFTVLVGDAGGADTCVQKYLAERVYANVLVFCTGACRNNAGGWKTMVITANAGERGFDFYALKDREMAREADYGFMVWDGKSKGTLNNVLNLLDENKSALVFLSPQESFHTIRDAEDLSTLLAKCGERALTIFEEKLAHSKRLSCSRGTQTGSKELRRP